jgi:hypothetical protein
MNISLRRIALGWLVAAGSAAGALAAEPGPKLAAGGTITIAFPEMPPTFYAVFEQKDVKAQMTVFLPVNYDPGRKHPLLVFLNGGDGGPGGNPGVARALCEGKDFVCVSVPLFKAPGSPDAPGAPGAPGVQTTQPNAPAPGAPGDPGAPGAPGFQTTQPNAPGFQTTPPNVPATPGSDFIMRGPDARYMWPFFKAMLAKLEEVVPNLDPGRRVLGGFSNGAHAAAGLLDESDGEVARRFSAFLFVEGGGRLQHYDLLKGKPFLMVSSNAKSRPRAQEICDAAKAAGAKATLIVEDVGKHDFPVAAYPAVREWLRGAAR